MAVSPSSQEKKTLRPVCVAATRVSVLVDKSGYATVLTRAEFMEAIHRDDEITLWDPDAGYKVARVFDLINPTTQLASDYS